MNTTNRKLPLLQENKAADYTKLTEWMLLKKYSSASIKTLIRTVEYFRRWANTENIFELESISYQDAMSFIQWSSKHGAAQKTIQHYITHLRKYYQFLISENVTTENPVAHIKIQGITRKIYYNILTTEELQSLHSLYPTTIAITKDTLVKGWSVPPQELNIISRRRNKVILSLLIHQGLRAEEVAALNVQDVQLREGKIMIHAKRRTAARLMNLESHQVYELIDYINTTRKEMLNDNNRHSTKLFLQRKDTTNFYGITQNILQQLRTVNNKIKNLDQIRASVITAWLKQYDLRKVQYLAGHKYVSSTEDYKANVIDELQDDITKFHPL
jgi:integrase/recombinase XerD